MYKFTANTFNRWRKSDLATHMSHNVAYRGRVNLYHLGDASGESEALNGEYEDPDRMVRSGYASHDDINGVYEPIETPSPHGPQIS